MSEGAEGRAEGRGADTSSCGAIALQRKCDTFPIVPEDKKAATGQKATERQGEVGLAVGASGGWFGHR